MPKMTDRDERLLDIRNELEWLAGPGRIRALAFSLLEKLLGFKELNRLLGQAARRSSDSAEFLSALVEILGFEVKLTGPGKDEYPVEGPVIVASNHPFGGADAIVVSDFAIRGRTDTLCLVNEFIASVKPARQIMIEVNVFDEDAEAKRRNLRSLREVGRHLQKEGQLVLFPGGEVASLSWREKQVTEPEWPALIGSLARRYQARVIPVFLPGRNSLLFHLLGLVHPFLRSAWLARELLRQQNSTIELRIGCPIEVDPAKTTQDIVAEIREAVFGLE